MKRIERITRGVTLSMAVQVLALYVVPSATVFAAAVAPGVSGEWALNNLAAMAVTVIVGMVAFLVSILSQEGSGFAPAVLLPVIASVAVFFLTEDMGGAMIPTDSWTIPMLVLEAIAVILAVLAVGRERSEARREEQTGEDI